jgi:hypothetical protein
MIAIRQSGLTGIIFLCCLFAFPCFADEILFQNQNNLQTGVVVGEDAQSVTIRFAKETIKSITKNQKEVTTLPSEKVVLEEGGEYLILKIPRNSIQVIPTAAQSEPHPKKPEPAPPAVLQSAVHAPRNEGQLEKNNKTAATPPSPSSESMILHQGLLREEMGGVEGVILWEGKPLQNAKVKIVLVQYTGFSLAALKKMYPAKNDNNSGEEIALDALTDSQGHYVFPDAPAGNYRLYWVPDPKTGWVHRLREKPDFEIVAGNLTVLNIPEKTK